MVTHCSSVVLAPSSREMGERATFTIVASSPIVSIAAAITPRASQGDRTRGADMEDP